MTDASIKLYRIYRELWSVAEADLVKCQNVLKRLDERGGLGQLIHDEIQKVLKETEL